MNTFKFYVFISYSLELLNFSFLLYQVEQLQRRIAPHLLRRVKEDVARDIPPKEETIIDVELTTMQKQYYRAIFEHNHGFLMQVC